MTPRFIALSYSPWSEKARWALDHHRVAYRYQEYVPMLGEPFLRARVGRATGRVTVPVLLDDGRALVDSFDIARHAEQLGSGAPLFPSAELPAITRWNERSQAALAAGRAIVVERSKTSALAKQEALPPFVPQALRPLLAGVATIGMRYVGAKYRDLANLEGAQQALVDALVELRAALGGKPYLLGALTYADVAMAVSLQFVRPVRDEYVAIGPGTRDVWTNPALEDRFADLLAWRDRLYDAHRRS